MNTKKRLNIMIPDILDRVNDELDKKIVGEENARKTIFLTSCLKLVKNAKATSSNLCVNAKSGTGKDWVMKASLSLWPEYNAQLKKGCYLHRTRISPTALTYWHRSDYEENHDWTWDDKILALEDVASSVLNCEVLKTMSSGGSYSAVTIKQRTFDLKIVGKPVIIITTAESNPKPELLRRFPMLYLDESVDQTTAIMQRQATEACTGIDEEYDPELVKEICSLERVKVVIPYADKLPKLMSKDHVIGRTSFPRFLDYIKASAALHQHYRQLDGESSVIATEQDYEIVRGLFEAMHQNNMMIPLTHTQTKVLTVIKAVFPNDYWTVKDLSGHVGFISERLLYEVIDDIQENFLYTRCDKTEWSDKPVRSYKIRGIDSFSLPPFKVMTSNNISN